MAEEFGGAVLSALQNNTGIADLSPSEIKQLSKAVIDYQLTRVRREFEADPEYRDIADLIPSPAVVFAPYFYIDPNDAKAGLSLLSRCASGAVEAGKSAGPVHAVLCTDVSTLSDPEFLNEAASLIEKSGVAGVWLWFSKFYEEAADLHQLQNLRGLVENLRESVDVYSMHGGYFSLALSRFGLKGVSHGIGYGEQKDVIPVIGQSTPTVRYYLPDLRRRLGVPQIERALQGVGVKSPADFFDKVCACGICKGIQTDIRQFSAFGDLHYSSENSKRMAQTRAAAQRCRFHFLLNRMRERDQVGKYSAAEIATDLHAAHAKWGKQPTIRGDVDHLLRWETVLRS